MLFTYLKVASIVLISILLLNAQLRIVSSIFSSPQQKKQALIYTLGMGGVIAWAILVYTYYIQPQLIDPSPLRYSTFILISWAILSFLCARKKQRWGLFIISTATVLGVLTWGISRFLAWSSISILLLKAAGEEILKTASSQSLISHNAQYKSDVIIMSILAWLWFAIFENLTYFIIGWSRWQFFVRSITTSLLHGIFTWCIGYVLRRQSKTSFTGYIYAYLIWIGLHSIYNLIISYSPIIWGITCMIWWYFLLTYLLYNSDRIYAH